MRRGLMGWDAEELPVGTLNARLERLRDAMRRNGLDAFLIYTNITRPSAVTYLTGFTPYWSDGLLLVGASGEPAFATALSKRVSGWIMSTSPVMKVVNTPRPGTAVGERLAADVAVKRAGVLELDALPAGIADDLATAAPSVALVDASAIFAECRSGVDAAERRLLMQADALAHAALDLVIVAPARDVGSVAATIERHVRAHGAEDVQIAAATDLDRDRRMVRATGATPLANRFALRASVAYKGCWVRRTRTRARDSAGAQAVARADAWFASVLGTLAAGRPIGQQLAEQVGAFSGATLDRWMAERCVGSYPLQVVAGPGVPGPANPADGDFFMLTVELKVGGIAWIGAAPVFVGR
jgi:hypothetical protein